MKYLTSILLVIISSTVFFFVGRESPRPEPEEQQEKTQFLSRQVSTQFSESEEFIFPGAQAVFHIPNIFSLSDGGLRLLQEDSRSYPACLEYTMSTLPSRFVFFTLAHADSRCLAETSFPHASNILIEQPFSKICDNPRYTACTSFSPHDEWMAVHAFTFITAFTDPQNSPGSLAYFYALTNPSQKEGYNTIVISLSSENPSILPNEYEQKVSELSTELASDHPLYAFQQDMRTLDTLIRQIVFEEIR